MTAVRTIGYMLAVTAVTSVLALKAFAAGGAGQQVLQDDFVIAGVDGTLATGESDKWVFKFDTELSDGKARLEAEQALEMLPSATLEQMTADAKTRVDARYRLWGKVTVFEGRNYILPVYYLALRKLEQPAAQGKAAEKGATSPAVNAPNDILSIPTEIVAKLQTSEVLPSAQAQPGLALKQDTVFVDRAGLIISSGDGFAFVPDGLGRGIETSQLVLLPCQALERTLEEIHGGANPVRVNVAGILTKYKGRQYLLLQRATRVYTYGNFGGR